MEVYYLDEWIVITSCMLLVSYIQQYLNTSITVLTNQDFGDRSVNHPTGRTVSKSPSSALSVPGEERTGAIVCGIFSGKICPCPVSISPLGDRAGVYQPAWTPPPPYPLIDPRGYGKMAWKWRKFPTGVIGYGSPLSWIIFSGRGNSLLFKLFSAAFFRGGGVAVLFTAY